MPVFFARRLQNVLVPDGDESHAEFERVPRGKTVRCDVTQPRSLPFHKLYFALCQRIGHGIGQTTDWVDRAFRIETGHVDVFEYGGKAHLVVRSIAFHNMDGVAFKDFWESCLRVMYERWQIDPASVNDLVLPQEVQKHR